MAPKGRVKRTFGGQPLLFERPHDDRNRHHVVPGGRHLPPLIVSNPTSGVSMHAVGHEEVRHLMRVSGGNRGRSLWHRAC
jgi:hypothetical protein